MNQILALVDRDLQENLDAEELSHEAVRILNTGITSEDFAAVQEAISNPACPIPRVDMAGRIAGYLASVSGQYTLAFRVHVDVAHLLFSRGERRGFELAVEQFQIARQLVPKGMVSNKDWGLTMLEEGQARILLMQLGASPLENARTAAALFEQAQETLRAWPELRGTAQLQAGAIRLKLAEMNEDQSTNLEAAVRLFEGARAELAPGSLDAGGAKLNEGLARVRLAQRGTDPLENLRRAKDLCQQARQELPPSSSAYWDAYTNEVLAYLTLVEMGVDCARNLAAVVEACQETRRGLMRSDPNHRKSRLQEAQARAGLADRGVDPVMNLEAAVLLSMETRQELTDQEAALLGSTDQEALLGSLYAVEAAWRERLARLQVTPERHLREAIRLYHLARKFFSSGLLNPVSQEVAAWIELGELGIEPIVSLQTAVQVSTVARVELSPQDPSFSRLLFLEASARAKLVDLEVHAAENLTQAAELLEQFRNQTSLAARDPEIARVVPSLEVQVRTKLLDLGIDPRAQAQALVHLYAQIRKGVAKDSREHTVAIIWEGMMRARLADLGVEPIANLETALVLYAEAGRRLSEDSEEVGLIRVFSAGLHGRLAELGQQSETNLQQALDLWVLAQRELDPSSPLAVLAQLAEGTSRLRLADLGVNPVKNLLRAVEVLRDGQRRWAGEAAVSMSAWIEEAHVCVRLGEHGVEAVSNYRQAVRLARHSRLRLAPGSLDYAAAQSCEAVALVRLAELGLGSAEDVHRSITLLKEARTHLAPEDARFGSALLNEALARLTLARMRNDPLHHLKKSIELLRQVREHAPHTGLTYYGSLANEATALVRLADHDADAETHLLRSIELSRIVREAWPERSSVVIAAWLTEGHARERLASRRPGESGAAEDIAEAVACYERAERLCPPSRLLWGQVRADRADLLYRTGKWNEALSLLPESIQAIEASRREISNETDRIAYADAHRNPCDVLIKICLDLASGTSAAQGGEGWRWEAWRWTLHRKNRLLLDLLSDPHPTLDAADRWPWLCLEMLSQALDERDVALDRHLRRMESHMGPAAGRGTSSPLPAPRNAELPPEYSAPEAPVSADLLAEYAALALEHAQLQQVYQRNRCKLLQQMTRAAASPAPPLPVPLEVLRDLRELAGAAPLAMHVEVASQGLLDVDRRPLLVDFFGLGEDEWIVFLVPLWADYCPIVERLSVAPGAVRQMTERLRRALHQVRHSGMVAGGASASHLDTSAEAAMQVIDDLPREMAQLLSPWSSHLDEWRPSELIISPHSMLNVLPLHTAEYRGKPLIDHYPVVYLPTPALAPEILKRRKVLAGDALLLGNPTNDLPGSEAEVRAVARCLSSAGIRSHCFVGPQATTGQVFSQGPAAGILHLAAHSQLDVHDFGRSGIVLADRRLTVLDISILLPLEQAMLVYLNSCDSAHPLPKHWDELMALVRAFMYAGASSVLAGLWPLRDDVAAAFATHFYHVWIKKQASLGGAYRRAVQAIRQQFPSVYCWGPFVLMGEFLTRGGSVAKEAGS